MYFNKLYDWENSLNTAENSQNVDVCNKHTCNYFVIILHILLIDKVLKFWN
jgi:hypothetical protein